MHSEIGNQSRVEIIAYHGWGFDAGFWNGWQKILPDNVIFKKADRGYFGEERASEYSPELQYRMLLLHSFGLHWCPSDIIRRADCIVFFNGFDDFHPSKKNHQRKSKLILRRMITKFKKKPSEVLQQFWANTFYPEKKIYKPKGNPNLELLYAELKKLNSESLNFEVPSLEQIVIVLEGGKDKILETPRRKELLSLAGNRVKYRCIEEAGHGLPYTHSEECWSFISSMIPIFEDNGN